MKKQVKIDQALKWVATIILFVGSIVNSMGFYPLGPIILIAGGLCWLAVSIMWREPSLIATNATMTIAAIGGLIVNYMGWVPGI